VFILGLPRSGKTSLERILNNHPDFYAAGETKLFNRVIQNFTKEPLTTVHVLQMSRDKLTKIAEKYLTNLAGLASGEKFFINTIPENFYYIGIIRMIFPNAKVVHCYRDPLSNCIDIYKKYFSQGNHGYSYDTQNIFEYYRGYHELMTHWLTEFPEFVHTVPFGSALDSDASTLKALFSKWNLDWNEDWTRSYLPQDLSEDRKIDSPWITKSEFLEASDSVRNYGKHFQELRKQLETLPSLA